MSACPEPILFDFDGVLADTEPLHWEAWNEALATIGVQVEWERYRRDFIGIPEREFVEALAKGLKPPRAADEVIGLYKLKNLAFRRRSANGGLVSQNVIERMKSFQNRKLGVVTSSSRSEIEAILLADGVLPLLAAVVYGEDVSNRKPHPEPYRLALERMGVPTALVFEDSDAGAESATAAGCTVVRVGCATELPELLAFYAGD